MITQGLIYRDPRGLSFQVFGLEQTNTSSTHDATSRRPSRVSDPDPYPDPYPDPRISA